MSGQHTPGPWQAIEGATTGRLVIAPEQPKVRRNVAAVGGRNRDANADLIAAAPDLLKSAEVVLAGLNARIEQADPSSVPLFSGIVELSDAIAKARGAA